MKIQETKSTEGLTPLQKIFSAPIPRGHKLWSFTKHTGVLMWHDLNSLPRNETGRIVIVQEKGVMWFTAATRKKVQKLLYPRFTVFKNGNSPSVAQ